MLFPGGGVFFRRCFLQEYIFRVLYLGVNFFLVSILRDFISGVYILGTYFRGDTFSKWFTMVLFQT